MRGRGLRALYGVAVGALCLCADATPLFTATALADEPRFDVALDRPEQVGRTYRLEAAGELDERNTMLIDGKEQPIRVAAFEVELIALAKVEQVDELGRPTRVLYAVERCIMRQGEQATAPLGRGARIVAERFAGGTAFTVDGAAPDAELHAALDLLIALPDPEASDEAVFGSDDPQPLAQPWPADRTAAAHRLVRQGIRAAESSIAGRAELRAVREVHGSRCLEVMLGLAAIDFAPADESLPPDVRFANARYQHKRWRLLPLSPDAPPLADSIATWIEFDMVSAGAVFRSRTQRKVKHKYLPTP